MILPRNGRVIIIDDQADQALPLINAFSKYNIASTYFNATKETIPVKRFNDVRVVFLDINLNDGPSNWSIERSLLIAYVTAIIEPGTPYILFVWSVKEDTQFSDVVKLFDEELSDYKPILAPMKMDKSSFFKREELAGKDVWVLNYSLQETIDKIKKKINEGLAEFDSLEALLKWENVVSDASALVVNDILILANNKDDINNDLKQIYYNLSHAYWGKTLIGKSPQEIIAKSLLNLNILLNDKIEYKLGSDFKIDLIRDFPPNPIIDIESKSKLNTRLLFSEDVIAEALPGNLYLLENEPYKRDIIENLVDRITFGTDYCTVLDVSKDDFWEGQDIKKKHKKPFTSFSFKKVEEVIKDANYFEIELTPICDYSQNNRLFCRMISGVILDQKYFRNQKRSASFFFVSPLFLMDGKPVNFYCDFRYTKSTDIKSINGIMPKLRIRHSFQAEIQSHLARQISRPGIVAL